MYYASDIISLVTTTALSDKSRKRADPPAAHHGEQHTQELQHCHPEHIFYAGLRGVQHNVRDPGDQNVRKKDHSQDTFRP